MPGGRLCPRRPPHHGSGMCPVRSHADAQLFASICQGGMGAPLLRRLERRNEVHRLAVSAAYRVGWCCPSFLDSGSTAVVGLGPHRVEHTPSRPIWAVKQRRARLVLAWVTGWESRVSKPPGIAHFASLPLLFFFSPSLFRPLVMDKHRAVVNGHARSLTLFFENGAGARHGHFKRCAVLLLAVPPPTTPFP